MLITDSRTDRSYIEKGEETELFYELEHNAEGELTSLVVGHLEVKPERQTGMRRQAGYGKCLCLLRTKQECIHLHCSRPFSVTVQW